MRRALCIYVTARSLNCWQSYDLGDILSGIVFSAFLAGSCIVADILFTFAVMMKLPSLSVGHDTLQFHPHEASSLNSSHVLIRRQNCSVFRMVSTCVLLMKYTEVVKLHDNC